MLVHEQCVSEGWMEMFEGYVSWECRENVCYGDAECSLHEGGGDGEKNGECVGAAINVICVWMGLMRKCVNMTPLTVVIPLSHTSSHTMWPSLYHTLPYVAILASH